jgi:hypothetical protein
MKVPIPALVIVSALASAPGSTPAPAAAATREQTFAAVFDPGARRHSHYIVELRRDPAREPHYYARPVYYRPYPYGVPAPFVLGFGPFW